MFQVLFFSRDHTEFRTYHSRLMKKLIFGPYPSKKYIYLLTTYPLPTIAVCHLGAKKLFAQAQMYYGS